MSHAQPNAAGIGELTGRVIGGRYRLGEMLGQGGMGVVYAAVQESLARPVALKMLQPMLAQSGASILRFKAEAERAGRLAHPHIVQILDFGHEPNTSAWIAMELLRGESLGARIGRGAMSEAEAVHIARETLSALEAAHGAHLVHRDLKPDNIFLAQVPGIGTSVKVLDFGIAKLLDDDAAGKLTATGMLMGTPLYMAPEQARGEDVDQRADLYSLGAVLYEALTGRPPFAARNYNALLFSVLSELPMPLETYRPDISPALARVVARAMTKLPTERWQSAHEMAEALRAVQPSAHLPVLRVADAAALGIAPTMATPAPYSAAATPLRGGANTGVTVSAPSARVAPTTKEPRFQWWPLALAGGLLAVALLAFAGAAAVSTTSTPLAVAATAPLAQAATLTPVTPREAPMAPLPVPADDSPEPPIPAEKPSLPGTVSAAAAPIVVPIAAPIPVTRSDERRPVPREPVRPGPSAGPTQRTQYPTTESSPPPAPQPAPQPPGPSGPPPSTRAAAPVAPSTASAVYPRPYVGFSGGAYGGLADLAALRDPIEAQTDWADCWPRTEPAPNVNRGRDFIVDVAPTGQVISAQAAPGNDEPRAFASCVESKLRRLNFGPTDGMVITTSGTSMASSRPSR